MMQDNESIAFSVQETRHVNNDLGHTSLRLRDVHKINWALKGR